MIASEKKAEIFEELKEKTEPEYTLKYVSLFNNSFDGKARAEKNNTIIGHLINKLHSENYEVLIDGKIIEKKSNKAMEGSYQDKMKKSLPIKKNNNRFAIQSILPNVKKLDIKKRFKKGVNEHEVFREMENIRESYMNEYYNLKENIPEETTEEPEEAKLKLKF